MSLPLTYLCRKSLSAQELVTEVIEPVLYRLREIPFEIGAPQLMLGVALHESGGLRHRTQLNGGPARGIYQMEGATHNDIWANFLRYKPELSKQVKSLSVFPNAQKAEELVWNDNYATAMCRVHFYRYVKQLPDEGKIAEQAAIWKKYYNTHLGKGTVEKYMKDWRDHGGASVQFLKYTPA